MSLPMYPTEDNALSLLQTQWAKMINPVLGSPIATPTILSNVTLNSGNNTVNHMLGQNLTGWIIIRQRGRASVYDNQNNNSIPNKTLLLISTSGVSVDLLVF